MTRSYSFARSSPDAKLLEVFVGEVVRLLARVHEEAQEPALQRAVVRRLPRVEEGPSERDVVPLRVAVPRVWLAVAVRVVEVVGLPRVGRQHDRDAVDSRHRCTQDEGRERDGPAARRRQPREVEAALPRAGPDGQRVHVSASEPPHLRRSPRTTDAAPPALGPGAHELQLEPLDARADDQPGRGARRIRGRGERRRQRGRRPLVRRRGGACGDDRRGDRGAAGGCHADTEQIPHGARARPARASAATARAAAAAAAPPAAQAAGVGDPRADRRRAAPRSPAAVAVAAP